MVAWDGSNVTTQRYVSRPYLQQWTAWGRDTNPVMYEEMPSSPVPTSHVLAFSLKFLSDDKREIATKAFYEEKNIRSGGRNGESYFCGDALQPPLKNTMGYLKQAGLLLKAPWNDDIAERHTVITDSP